MLALSSWTWVVVAGFGILSIGLLAPVTFGLIGRLRDLNATLKGASGTLNEALDRIRSDLDEASERLAELRDRGNVSEPGGRSVATRNSGEKGRNAPRR